MVAICCHPDAPCRDHRRCLRCKERISAQAGFFELTRQPSGDLFTLCSLDCLAAFVRGGEVLSD